MLSFKEGIIFEDLDEGAVILDTLQERVVILKELEKKLVKGFLEKHINTLVEELQKVYIDENGVIEREIKEFRDKLIIEGFLVEECE